jgi:drug/metabolite transporter (DMT)-like permease
MSYHRPAMSSLTFAYALLAALSLAAMVIGFKLASSGIHPVLGTAIVTGTAFLVNVVVALVFRAMAGPMTYSTSSALLLLLVGMATASVNLFTLLAYTSGLKVTSSVMIGGVSTVVIMLIGFLILKEPFSWTRLLAIGLIVGGVFILQRAGI